MEKNRFNKGTSDNSDIGFLQGRNEELRLQLIEAKSDLTRNQITLNKVQEEVLKEFSYLKTALKI